MRKPAPQAGKGVPRYDLVQDRRGMMWDLLLYIPTVFALLMLAAKFWYGDEVNLAYLFAFLASFFAIAGINRVLKTRLMLLPTSPVAIEVCQPGAGLVLRNGERVDLVGDVRFYTDYSGRTFGLAGIDKAGQRLQFVFHKGQFAQTRDYDAILSAFRKT